MVDHHYSLLFLSQCNSVRSLMAEALTNHLGQGRFTAASAGGEPARQNDPLALDVLRVANIPYRDLRPKHWRELRGQAVPASTSSLRFSIQIWSRCRNFRARP